MGQVGIAVLGHDLRCFPQHLPRRHVDQRIKVRSLDGLGDKPEILTSLQGILRRTFNVPHLLELLPVLG